MTDCRSKSFFLLLSLLLTSILFFPTVSGNPYNMQTNDNYDMTGPLGIDSLLYSAYLGGEEIEYGTDIAVDHFGNVYITGYTNSHDFPIDGYVETNQRGSYDCFVMKFNPTCELLLYSAIIGGTGSDRAYSIAVDNEGNAYVVGQTSSDNFPIVNSYDTSYNGGSDCFLFKLNPDGDTLLYSSYIGGSNSDSAESIFLDESGNVYIAGSTWSFEFPVTLGAFDESYNADGDGFVLKLNSVCDTLNFSTFFGGFGNDYLYSIVVDSVGAAYVAGMTTSRDIPTTSDAFDISFNGGYWDCMVFKLDSEGKKLNFSTYYGGSDSDDVSSILVDSYGDVYMVGTTSSTDFPSVYRHGNVLDRSDDCYVLKLDSSRNSIVFSTIVGGSRYDYGGDFAIDSNGCIIVTGETYSSDFPITSASIASSKNERTDVFAFKLNSSGNEILYSTLIGGSHYEEAYAIALDSEDNAIMTGYTRSPDFPTQELYSSTFKGNRDCILLKIPDLTDSDGDSLPDVKETALGTDLYNVDTDMDGYSDYWEYQNGFDPTDSVVPLSEFMLFFAPTINLLAIITFTGFVVVFRHQIRKGFRKIWPKKTRTSLYECPSCKTQFEAPRYGLGSRRRICPECGTRTTADNRTRY
ncbi:MAG: SBBP repeat-containing protein [Candidatus Thorarchaeota archaeon]|nr:SBBP repeat-containing protein [Candidatus Thorarchaeota archaeon]